MTCHTPRRRFLCASGSLAAAGLAGCLGGDDAGPPPDPIALDDGQICDVCGMSIADHYGPAGQVFYAGDHPPGRDGPARFDSVTELLTYDARRETRGWERLAVYVTDYSRVSYTIDERDGVAHISTHVAAEDFTDATECVFVVNSGVRGAMGPDHVPFSEHADAEAFLTDHGGAIREWDALVGD